MQSFIDFSCPVCNSNKYSVVYNDTIKNDIPKFDYNFSPEHNLSYRIIKCLDCSHHYASPRPENIWENYKNVVDNAYLQNERQYSLTNNKVVRHIKKFIQNGKLLDVGCATGSFLDAAKESFEVEGLELSQWSSDIAKNKGMKIHNCPLIDLKMVNYYDVITLWGVIEHLEFPGKELSYINKILKHNGLVCLWTGDINSFFSKILKDKWWYIQGQHIQYFTQKSLLKLFKDNGFELINMSIYPYVMSLASLNASLGRYPLINKITKPLFCNKMTKDIKLTIKLPGEMFAIFRKI